MIFNHTEILKNTLPATSTAVVKIVIGYPFETIKTREQLGLSYNFNLKKLYKGCHIQLIASIIKRTVIFYNYEKYNKKYNSFIASGYSSIIASIISNPLNIIRVNIQSNRYVNVKQQLKLNILTKGNKINILRDILFSTYYLGMYGNLKKQLPDKPIYHSFSSIFSGTTVWILFMPFDNIRTHIYNDKSYQYLYHYFKKDPIHLWKGSGVMILKAFPVNLVNMMLYEYLRKSI